MKENVCYCCLTPERLNKQPYVKKKTVVVKAAVYQRCFLTLEHKFQKQPSGIKLHKERNRCDGYWYKQTESLDLGTTFWLYKGSQSRVKGEPGWLWWCWPAGKLGMVLAEAWLPSASSQGVCPKKPSASWSQNHSGRRSIPLSPPQHSNPTSSPTPLSV